MSLRWAGEIVNGVRIEGRRIILSGIILFISGAILVMGDPGIIPGEVNGIYEIRIGPLIAAEIHAGISCHTHLADAPHYDDIGHIDIGAHLFYFCSLYAAYDGGRGYCKIGSCLLFGNRGSDGPKIELEVNPRGLLFDVASGHYNLRNGLYVCHRAIVKRERQAFAKAGKNRVAFANLCPILDNDALLLASGGHFWFALDLRRGSLEGRRPLGKCRP